MVVVPHLWSIISRAATFLYEDDGRAAYDLLTGALPGMRRSGVLGVHTLRVVVRHHRGSAAVAAAAAARGTERRRLLAVAARDARALAGEGAAWARGLSLLVRAGVAATSGEQERARRLLQRALIPLEHADMAHFVAAVRARLGSLAGGEAGAVHSAAAAAWAASQSARAADRLWHLWAPGFR